MEMQLQELIEKIKSDGVKVAEEEAATIRKSAEAEAEKILADAKAESEKMLADAKAENERLLRVSEDAIRQAGRNLLLSLRESVSRELTAAIGEKVAASYTPETLAALIPKVVESWAKQPEVEDITVLLGGEDLAAVEEALLSALKARVADGVTLRASDTFDGGFRVAVNGGSIYYDYSASAVTDMLASYLNPRVTALMKEAERV